MRIGWLASALTMGCLAVVPATASGFTTIGQTFDPPSDCAPTTFLQTASSFGAYTVPSAGVITAWSHQADEANPATALKFKVGRSAGGNSYTIIGESPLTAITPGVLNTFTNVRIPVQPGDVIGEYVGGPGNPNCSSATAGGAFVISFPSGMFGDRPAGSTGDYNNQTGHQIDLSARLESDADGDGYGDESQDDCSTDATTQGACDTDPPETTITKRPKNKTGKPKATYKFVSDEPGSIFECRLKGKGLDTAIKQFNACTSPRKYKNLDPGKYVFKVRATDIKGNTDLTPAKDKFKVVGWARSGPSRPRGSSSGGCGRPPTGGRRGR